MSLREEIKTLSGNKRRFFLLRIADMDTKASLKLCGVVRGTYNSWLQNTEFVEIYRRRREFAGEYKQEAIQLLRRDNQLEAVLLEGKIVSKMKEELESGEYSLIRSHLAREVYSKLISDLDVVPQTQLISWEQRLQSVIISASPSEQIPEGEVIEGEIINAQLETDSEQESQHKTSQLIQESQQTTDKVEEEV